MKDYHKAAVVRADEFVQVMSNEKTDICSQMNHAMADRVASNRQKLASIIIFCGRQNMGLRGHRDNATDLEKKTFVNHGNFLALLQFRIDAGDNILKEHLATSSRSATYTSSTIQNQVIDIICHQIQHIIFDKVKKGKWFTVVLQTKLQISPIKSCLALCCGMLIVTLGW